MGNICRPRKIIFVKPKSFGMYKLNEIENNIYNCYKQNYITVESKEAVKINTNSPDKKEITKESQKTRIFSFQDSCILISRGGSQKSNTSNKSNENSSISNENYYSDSSTNSSLRQENSQTPQSINLNQTVKNKQQLMNKFKKIFLEIPVQETINIQKITDLLENASRNNLASVIDMTNREGNTAICLAILRNDNFLLQSLLKFTPDFPQFISLQNSKLPLVQVAAIKSSENDGNRNILTIILQKWIDDYSYRNVALNNIFTLNSDSQDLFQFLIDKIRQNHSRSIQFTNLKLLLMLFQQLFYETLIKEQIHPDIYKLCKNMGEHFFNQLETCEKQKNCVENLEKLLFSNNNNQ